MENKKRVFTLTFRILPSQQQERKLNTLFDVSRRIYNSHLHELYRRYDRLQEDQEWKRYKDLDLKNKKRKAMYKLKLKEYGLNNWMVLNDFNRSMRQYYSAVIPARVAINVSKKAYRVFNRCILFNPKKDKKIKWGRVDKYNCVEGSDNTGICFKDSKIIYITRKMKKKVVIDIDKRCLNDPYNQKALKDNEIKYVRLLRDQHKGKWSYHAQVIMGGLPPKLPKVGKGRVGLDMGPSTIAYVSHDQVGLKTLAPSIEDISKKVAYYQRKMDRSKRATNPDNYNENGTIKKGKKTWVFSNHYYKIKAKLHDLQRKQKNIRKLDHELLANQVVSMGDQIYEETMRWKSLARRAKETKKDEKTGKNRSKRRYGKSIGQHAPSLLNGLIEQKLGYYDKELLKTDTSEMKASQYHHDLDEFIKKDSDMNKRWKTISGHKVQRDLYSAFLIQHSNGSLDKVDKASCDQDFDEFLVLHDQEINRLKASKEKKTSSMGI